MGLATLPLVVGSGVLPLRVHCSLVHAENEGTQTLIAVLHAIDFGIQDKVVRVVRLAGLVADPTHYLLVLVRDAALLAPPLAVCVVSTLSVRVFVKLLLVVEQLAAKMHAARTFLPIDFLLLLLVFGVRVLLDDDDNERLRADLAKTTPSNCPAREHLLQPRIHLLPSRSCLGIHLDAVAVGLGLVPDAVAEVVGRRHLGVCSV